MRSRLVWRRLATAAGIYASAILGFLGTVVAARLLGPAGFGLFALVVATTAFFQLLLDLTVEEAAVKYGFRYVTQEDWGRLRRLLGAGLLFKLAGGAVAGAFVAGLAPLADAAFNAQDLLVPMLLAAPLPLVQAPEGVASAALLLRGRYDVRGALLTVSMALRLAALAVGARYGVAEAIGGLLAAQALSTAAVGAAGWAAFRRFPAAPAEPLGSERRDVARFVLQSSVGTGLVSLRAWIAPILLGVVTGPLQVGFFRAAQAPQSGFASLSAPVRLILLTEQTRDWERGRADAVFSGLRRYVVGSSLLMALVVPPLVWLMPDLVRIVFSASFLPASDAARIVLVAAAVQLVFGWSKSFPVSIGRPNLRILAHGVELAVLVPLLVALGAAWETTGAAWAVLASTLAFAAVWAVLVLRLRRGPLALEVAPS